MRNVHPQDSAHHDLNAPRALKEPDDLGVLAMARRLVHSGHDGDADECTTEACSYLTSVIKKSDIIKRAGAK